MSQYSDTYQLGATQIIVGTGISLIVQVNPDRCRNGGFFKRAIGSGGTLAIVNGMGSTAANGYILGETEVVSFQGPALFFLAAMGATVTVAFVPSYNMGFSQAP